MYKKALWIAGVVFFASCGSHHSHEHGDEACTHEHHHGDEKHVSGHLSQPENGHDEKHDNGEIVFTAEQAEKSGVGFYSVEPGDFHEVVATSGKILPAQGDEINVVAAVSGVIFFGPANLSEGRTVNRGDVLFYISSKNVADGDYIARSRAAYEQAESAYRRAESLVKEQIVSQKEFEQRKYEYEVARTAYEALNKTSEKGVAVVSPLPGYVKNVFVSEGAYVNVGDPIAVVSQNRRLVLQAEVSQRYYGILPAISSANFETPYANKTYSLKALNGKKLSYGKSAAGGSFYIPVNFEFDNPGDVFPGSYVSVYLISSPLKDALTVPVSALVEEQGFFYVYVKTGEEHYEKREVVIGGNDGRSVQVLSGLERGETVVSEGAYQIRLASVSGAIPEGHSHSH